MNHRVNVTGIVVAGSADFKTELAQSDMFDQRLQAKVIKVADISYGGENGFNQAIEQCAEVLQNVKFVQEKKLIAKYFDEISQVRTLLTTHVRCAEIMSVRTLASMCLAWRTR